MVLLFVVNLSKFVQKVVKFDLDSYLLIRFFDKFVYRNFKIIDLVCGVFIMQFFWVIKDFGDIWFGICVIGVGVFVNLVVFVKQVLDKVVVEDVFFYEYFQYMKSELKKVKVVVGEGDEEG